MEQAISSIQKLIWFAFRAIYTLVPSIFFIFSISAFIHCIDLNKLPSSIINLIHYFSELHKNNESVLFVVYISVSVVMGLLTETVSGIILWDKNYNNGNGNANDQDSYLNKLDVVIDTGLKAVHVGYADLVGVKIINEFENLNSFQWFIMSSKVMLLNLYIYVSFYLIFFIPLALAIHFNLTSFWYFSASGFETIFIFFLFLLTRWGLAKLKSRTPNWHDKIIAEDKELCCVFLPFVLAFVFFVISCEFPDNPAISASCILIGATFFFFPLNFFIVLGANNLHNRLRRIINSAFIQLRYDDVIFRGNPKKSETI